jgi:hypothetical protein
MEVGCLFGCCVDGYIKTNILIVLFFTFRPTALIWNNSSCVLFVMVFLFSHIQVSVEAETSSWCSMYYSFLAFSFRSSCLIRKQSWKAIKQWHQTLSFFHTILNSKWFGLVSTFMDFPFKHILISWLRHYATSRKVAGSSPNEVNILIDLILPAALWPWGRLSLTLTEMSTRNLPGGGGGVKGGRCERLTILPPSVSPSSGEHVGTSTSHNPMGLHDLLQG